MRRDLTADAEAMRLLHRQHGYASARQLYELGLSRSQIAYRARIGVLQRVAYGVLGLPDPPRTVHARAMRAALIVGDGATVCRWTAAELHGIDAPRSEQTHVVIQGRQRRDPRADIHVHRTRYLPADHVTEHEAVRITTLPRTVVDCAGELDHWIALQMLDSCAATMRMWRAIHATAEKLSNGRAGVRAIADATSPDGAQRIRSVLERRAADALAAYGVPSGEWNVLLHDAQGPVREVDLCYRAQHVVVEFDGLRFHERRAQARRDRTTDRRLLLDGWRVLRFTWQDVVHHPATMSRDVLRAVATNRVVG